MDLYARLRSNRPTCWAVTLRDLGPAAFYMLITCKWHHSWHTSDGNPVTLKQNVYFYQHNRDIKVYFSVLSSPSKYCHGISGARRLSAQTLCETGDYLQICRWSKRVWHTPPITELTKRKNSRSTAVEPTSQPSDWSWFWKQKLMLYGGNLTQLWCICMVFGCDRLMFVFLTDWYLWTHFSPTQIYIMCINQWFIDICGPEIVQINQTNSVWQHVWTNECLAPV